MRKSIKDDDIYGSIRAEICDAYIVAGKPKPERNWLYSRLVGNAPGPGSHSRIGDGTTKTIGSDSEGCALGAHVTAGGDDK